MLAKLYDESNRSWLLIDGVTFAEHHVSRFRVKPPESGELVEEDLSRPMTEEVANQNPVPKDWKPIHLRLDKLLIPLTVKEAKEGRTFKVVGLYSPQKDGTEIYRCYGFTTGYLLNDDGKTVERL